MTLFEAIKTAGIPFDNHESDLYIPYTPRTMFILDSYPLQKSNAELFISNIDHKRWIDIPFAFDPWWNARTGKGE